MFKKGMVLYAVVFLFFFGTAVFAQEKSPDLSTIILDSNRTIYEKLVIKIDPDWEIDSCKASPDCQRIACVFSTGRKGFAFVNGKKVVGDKCYVMVDGKKGKVYYDISRSSLIFSPDSKHLAYVAIYQGYEKGNSWCIVLDEVEGKWYHDIDELSLIFSPDSEHLAYVARLFTKYYIVIDGGRGVGYDEIIPIRGKMITFYSYDSLSYVVIYLGRKGDKIYLVREALK